MTRPHLRKICTEIARQYLSDDFEYGVCGRLDWYSCEYRSKLRNEFTYLFRPRFPDEYLHEFYDGQWLKKLSEQGTDLSCRSRRAMAVLHFAEAADLERL